MRELRPEGPFITIALVIAAFVFSSIWIMFTAVLWLALSIVAVVKVG